MGDNGSPQKKRSIDEIIEHMTTDIQMNDGQYVPLGVTPPPVLSSPHGWPEYASLINDNGKHSYTSHQSLTPGVNTVFLSGAPSIQSEVNASHLSKQSDLSIPHHFYYGAPTKPQQMNVVSDNHKVIGTVVDSGGNIVSVVYSGSDVTSQPYHIMTCENRDSMKYSLGQFIPQHMDSVENHMKDYNVFVDNEHQQQAQQSSRNQSHAFHDTVNNRAQLIENFVGNWVPNQSGTYSPFGCTESRVKHSMNHQGIQTTPLSDELDLKGIGRGVRKTRIVAEVRPMRPSYSDVLTKSPPTSVKSAANNTSLNDKMDSPIISRSKISLSKSSGSKRNNKSSVLKRQHSSGSEDHGNGGTNSNKVNQSVGLTEKTVGSCLKKNNNVDINFKSVPRKWASLDDLDNDKQLSELGGVFQAEDIPSKIPSNDSNAVGESNKKFVGTTLKTKCEDESFGATLNNHKPTAYLPSGKGPGGLGGPAAKRPPIHINNNLGTSTWSSGKGSGASNIGPGEKNILKGSSVKNCRNCPEERKASKSESKTGPAVPITTRPGSARNQNGGSEKTGVGKRRSKKKENPTPLGVIYRPIKLHVTHWSQICVQIVFWFFHLISDVLSMSGRLFVHLCAFFCDWLYMWSVHVWRKISDNFLQLKLFQRLGFQADWWNFWQSGKKSSTSNQSPGNNNGNGFEDGFPSGLENNISLPSTGEEAMRRLLACKGKDPYSILGVTPHCTDDDIKKYYKRQAVLVHPDKNNQPGAEEAFKILVHAFELIGEPERRTAYDRRVAETHQVEQAWSELSDLLSQLHKKMEYAANTIRCTNCGKRHRRIHLNRPCYAARFCAQCRIHHNAREGDIWAESSIFGFLWHYYACMDGGVYDITEWAACQADNLRHLRANTHSVQYRIVLGRQSQQSYGKHHGNKTSQRNAPESNSEPDLEDFLNNLYNQPSGNNGTAAEGGRPEQGRNRKKGKRKK